MNYIVLHADGTYSVAGTWPDALELLERSEHGSIHELGRLRRVK